MSNEIKPIAWIVGNKQSGPYALRKTEPKGWGYVEPLMRIFEHQSAIDRLTEERDSLAAQLAEYKADAERWRICRDPKHPTDGEGQPIIWLEGRGNLWVASEWLTGEFADRAADDAIYAARKES